MNTLLEMGNPFQDQADLVVLHNRNVMTHEAAQTVCKVFDIGQSQYKEFVKQRLVERSVSLHQPLKRNKLSLFVAEKAVTKSKSQNKIAAARNDANLFSMLYMACQFRPSDLDMFFKHENHAYPPALTDS